MTPSTSETKLENLLANIEHATGLEAIIEQAKAAIPATPLGSPKIMMVDDEKLNSYVVAEYLKSAGYRDLIHTEDPLHALAMAVRTRPDAILLDIHMPQLNGLEFLRQIRNDEVLKRTPVVILTSSTDTEDKLRAFEYGATDFLHKPIHGGELLARLRNILLAKAYQDQLQHYSETLEDAVRARTAELEASRREVIHCLARAAEFRDDDTGRHVIRVGRYARLIGEQLGLDGPALELLEQAAQLHDVGKIGIPDGILLKSGKLTPEQFEIMQKHCSFGKQIIDCLPSQETQQLRKHTELGAKLLDFARSPILELAMRIALTHHERWDGAGYPLGLAGSDIPLEGRITAVADVFDALSTKRPYKPPFPLEKCFTILEEGRRTQFDPAVLDAFFAKRDDIIQVQMAYADDESRVTG